VPDNTNAFFHIIEKAGWKYARSAKWGETNGAHVFAMAKTAGALNFVSNAGESFVVVLGVHTTNAGKTSSTTLSDEENAVVLVLPQYYGTDYPFGVEVREKQWVRTVLLVPNTSSPSSTLLLKETASRSLDEALLSTLNGIILRVVSYKYLPLWHRNKLVNRNCNEIDFI
jgi:hypothetical protein